MLDTSQPKGRTRATIVRANRRIEAKVKRQVRAACVKRDGMCRIVQWEDNPDDWHEDAVNDLWCDGESQWAHMEGSRRFETRGKPPEERHATHSSLILCQAHHDMYDGRHPTVRLIIRQIGDGGADGPLRFSTKDRT